jgi:multicomponent K+:H+ antiporter subunit D
VFTYGGVATITFGVFGLLASLGLGRIAGYAVIVSSGTLLSAIGVGSAPVTAAALYYLMSATLAASALFLLVELIEQTTTTDGARLPDVAAEFGEDTNLDDDGAPLVGRAIPMSLALLGLAFIACALLVAGLPPLSGFVAKFALLRALLGYDGVQVAGAWTTPAAAWSLFALLLLSGFAATLSLSRAGIRHFWSVADRRPRLELLEGAPVLALLGACLWLTIYAEPVMRYTRATADALHRPTAYIGAVLSTRAVPPMQRRDGAAEQHP